MKGKRTGKYPPKGNAGALALFALLWAVLLSGCPSPGTFYTLTAGAEPEAGGTVTAVPASENYLEGTMVMVTAEPAPGYAFSGWEGDADGAYALAAVLMEGDKTVTAKFTALPPETCSLTVVVSPAGCGTVSVSPSGPAYASGSTVTLTAHPGPGYTFLSWSGGTSGSTNPKSLTMDGNKTITAHFSAQNPGGSVQGSPLSISGAALTLAGAPGVGSQHYDGTGVGALFNTPSRMVLIGSYLYIADSGNHRIRRLHTSTGTAETFSGTGTAGHLDGAADAARFYGPTGITTDGTTYLYVTDNYSHTVRRVSLADGAVTTIAGISGSAGNTDNPVGTSATFNYPEGITFVPGSPDSLYLCNSQSYTVRKIELTGTFTVTTFAGTAGSQGGDDDIGSAARFRNLYGITSDGSSLWVADLNAHTIREIIISTTEVITRAGVYNTYGFIDAVGSAARFENPRDLLYSGGLLYISDTQNHALRVMDTSTYSVTTLTGYLGSGHADGGTGTAKFSYPTGLALSGTNLYASESGNHTIRRVNTATRNTVTLAGSPQKNGFWNGTGAGALYHRPRGITTDGEYLYTTDQFHTVRKINRTTGAVTTLAGSPNSAGSSDGYGSSALFSGPQGITVSGDFLYLCDYGNHTIRRISKTTGEVSTLAGYPGVSGSLDGTGSGARFYYPRGITTDGPNLYVTQGIHNIRKIEIATARVTTIAGGNGLTGIDDSLRGLDARFNNPLGITCDGSFLYICDSSNYAIRQLDLSTGEVSTLAGFKGVSGHADGTGPSARFRNPAYITCDGTYLYVTDETGHTVRRVGIASREVDTLCGQDETSGFADGAGTGARFNTPQGITCDGQSLFVCDHYNHVIRKID